MGLRAYATSPQVWGGDVECQHTWNVVKELKKNGKPKWPEYAECHCGAWRGELGLEPYVELYIQHLQLVMREVHRVLRDDGVVFLNIGDSSNADMRRPLRPGKSLAAKDALLVPWRLGLALQEDGWIVRQEIIWSKAGGNCPECGFRMEKGDAKPAPTRSKLVPAHEYVLLLSKKPEYYFDFIGIQEKPGVNRRDVLFLTSTRYEGAHYAVMSEHLAKLCVVAGTPPKACADCSAPYYRDYVGRSESKAERLERIGDYRDASLAPRHDGGKLQQGIHIGTFEKTTLGWQKSCNCQTQETTPGIVLDPFSGSGTTGAVALQTGRRYLGIDLDPLNYELASKRLGEAKKRHNENHDGL
jgi:DNA modification methylase